MLSNTKYTHLLAIVIAVGILVVTLTPSMLLYRYGYETTVELNKNFTHTECTVIDYDFEGYACNPYFPSGTENKTVKCGAYKNCCYSALVIYNYLSRYNKTVPVARGWYAFDREYLKTHFPINSTRECWYNINDPRDAVFELWNTMWYFVGSIGFLGLGLSGLIVFIVVCIASCHSRRGGYMSIQSDNRDTA
jgi:hypothetical protein